MLGTPRPPAGLHAGGSARRAGRYSDGVSWTVEDHTADVALVVEAGGWRELLIEAGRAFAGWIGAGAAPGARVERAIEVRGADATETWVQWWRALLRLWTVEGLLATEVEVAPDAGATGARGSARCVRADGLDAAQLADVKAVTWHGAEARADADGRWRGRIILDL